MLALKMSVKLGITAERLWDVVGNFNGLPDWHPWVRSSTLEAAAGGVGRRVSIDGGTGGPRTLTERLVTFNAESREYSYTIIAGPAPFVDYVGHFRVVSLNPEQCEMQFNALFRAAPGKTNAKASERIQSLYQAAFQHLTDRYPSRVDAVA